MSHKEVTEWSEVDRLLPSRVHILQEDLAPQTLRDVKRKYPRHTQLDGVHNEQIIHEAIMHSGKLHFSGLTAAEYERIFGGDKR